MDAVLRSGRFVAWGNAVLAGLVSPDTAADRICGRECHRVLGLSGLDESTLPVTLARLRTTGVTGLRLVLPVPGDLLGLPGPAEFNVDALDAGEAVLLDGAESWGLIPAVAEENPDDCPGTAVHWQAQRVNASPLDVLSLAEAERELAETMRAATDALDALDVARWRPEAADRISAIRSGNGADVLAPGYPPRAHRVLALAQRVSAIAALAADDDGAAFNSRGIAGRDAELRPLARAARRAQIAAYNARIESRV
ncbi:MAG TPA: hypothetical protein VMZ00_02265 [Sporichthya sp.]|nr:hypothetical protein [Sporichthya sp.]